MIKYLSDSRIKNLLTICKDSDKETFYILNRSGYRYKFIFSIYKEVLEIGVEVSIGDGCTDINYADVILGEDLYKNIDIEIYRLCREGIFGVYLINGMFEERIPEIVDNDIILNYFSVPLDEYVKALESKVIERYRKSIVKVLGVYYGDKEIAFKVSDITGKIVNIFNIRGV